MKAAVPRVSPSGMPHFRRSSGVSIDSGRPGVNEAPGKPVWWRSSLIGSRSMAMLIARRKWTLVSFSVLMT
jgi:hypothetical protein